MLTIEVPNELAAPLADQAARRGITPEELALDHLRTMLCPPPGSLLEFWVIASGRCPGPERHSLKIVAGGLRTDWPTFFQFRWRFDGNCMRDVVSRRTNDETTLVHRHRRDEHRCHAEWFPRHGVQRVRNAANALRTPETSNRFRWRSPTMYPNTNTILRHIWSTSTGSRCTAGVC